MTNTETFNIWPSTAPGSEDWMHCETEFRAPFADDATKAWRGIRNVVTPSLTVYRPTNGLANDAGVIVCPGGGNLILCYDYEGTDIAEWFAARGVTAFLLKYRVQPTPSDPDEFATEAARLRDTIFADLESWARQPNPWAKLGVEDAIQSLKLIREQASGFGVNPANLGIIGFSAGAGVAVGAALADPTERPNFCASIYGGDRSGRPTDDTLPPLFIVVSQDDPYNLAPENIELYQRWVAAGASADIHVFSEGGHGYGMRKLGLMTDSWPDLFERWLKKHGVFR